MKALLLSFILLAAQFVFAQKIKKDNIQFFIFDENWKASTMEKAKYFSALERLSDTAYEMKTYNFAGPIISIETYRDAEATTLHGRFVHYNTNGRMDTLGFTTNGHKDRWWYYYTDSFTLWQKEQYDNGKLLKKMGVAEMEEESRQRKQSLDTTIKKVEIEATFDGGEKKWRKHLEKKFEFPERAKNLKKSGTIILQFVIDKEGNVTEPSIIQSVEYSIDEEGLRMLQNAPKWKPAFQNGRYVKAYRRQPLTFVAPK